MLNQRLDSTTVRMLALTVWQHWKVKITFILSYASSENSLDPPSKDWAKNYEVNVNNISSA